MHLSGTDVGMLRQQIFRVPGWHTGFMLKHWVNILHTLAEGGLDLAMLVAENEEIEWCTLEESQEIWEDCAELSDRHFPYMKKVLEIEREFPCFEDFDLQNKRIRQACSYIDSLRKWTHSQSQYQTVPLKEGRNTGMDLIHSKGSDAFRASVTPSLFCICEIR